MSTDFVTMPVRADSLIHAETTKRGFSITAMVVGIASLFGAILGWIGLALSVTAIVFGILALVRKQSRGMAVSGIVTGSIGALGSLIVIFIAVFLVAVFGATIEGLETGDLTGLEELGFTIESE